MAAAINNDLSSECDECEKDFVPDYWLQLKKGQQKNCITSIFWHVVLNDDKRPAFMTEKDWTDLTQGARTAIHTYRGPTHYIILDLSAFAYCYWVPGCKNFFILADYFEHNLTKTKVKDVCLIQSVSVENMHMWVEINIQAIFLYMSQLH
jgi:hypothetical protein